LENFDTTSLSENYKKFEEMAEDYSLEEIETVLIHAKEDKLKSITELATQLTGEELAFLQKKITLKKRTTNGGIN